MSCTIPKEYQEKSFEKGVREFKVKGWRGFYQLIYEEFGLKEETIVLSAVLTKI